MLFRMIDKEWLGRRGVEKRESRVRKINFNSMEQKKSHCNSHYDLSEWDGRASKKKRKRGRKKKCYEEINNEQLPMLNSPTPTTSESKLGELLRVNSLPSPQ